MAAETNDLHNVPPHTTVGKAVLTCVHLLTTMLSFSQFFILLCVSVYGYSSLNLQ